MSRIFVLVHVCSTYTQENCKFNNVSCKIISIHLHSTGCLKNVHIFKNEKIFLILASTGFHENRNTSLLFLVITDAKIPLAYVTIAHRSITLFHFYT